MASEEKSPDYDLQGRIGIVQSVISIAKAQADGSYVRSTSSSSPRPPRKATPRALNRSLEMLLNRRNSQHGNIIKLAAGLVVHRCIPKVDLLRHTELTDKQFARAVGFMTTAYLPRESALARYIGNVQHCERVLLEGTPHYEATPPLVIIADKGLAGTELQDMVAAFRSHDSHNS